jgi:cyclophilin family peptidyl-prolyl cis-trans isomerase
MQPIAPLMVMFSVLFPSKLWFTPDQPLHVQVKGAGDVSLVLLDFQGKLIEADGNAQIKGDQTVDLMQIWRQPRTPGTYILLAVPTGKAPAQFVGTPLVVSVRGDTRREAPPGPMVIKIEPLCYAVMNTAHGDMTMAFYYDVAPNTTASFLNLAAGGYFDGLTFHRIISGFVLQGGDPRGDGTGGPGYTIPAEFSSRKHEEGVLSMARQGDPAERQGLMPRAEFANSAGSQFFVCLDYNQTKQLDGRYTAFGRVVDGLDIVRTLGKVKTDPKNDRPTEPQVIKSVKVFPVTAEKNPYISMLNLMTAPSMPPTLPLDPRSAPSPGAPVLPPNP